MAKGMHAAETPKRSTKKTQNKAAHKAPPKKSAAKSTAARTASKKSAPKKQKSGKGNGFAIAALVLVILIAATFAVGFAAGKSSTIHPNLMLDGIPVGGMSISDAEAALSQGGWEAREDGSVKVILPAGYEFTVTAEEAGLNMNSREAAEAAYAYGHSGSIFNDLAAYLKCITGKAGTSDILRAVDSDGIRAKVEKSVNELNEKLKSGYVVDTEKEILYVVKGADSVDIDIDTVFDLILQAFKNSQSEVVYPFEIEGDAACDFKAIHKEIFAEALSAEYDRETHKATESTIGVDFDVAEAEKLFAKASIGDMVEIPLKVTLPKYTQEQLDEMLFRDKLGSETTSYSSSASGRATNVELSASKINGVVLNPGETFSYNDVVGKRTAEAGFKTAAAYAGGKVVQEIGGGICQTSSTLYCAVLYANLKITARDCHHFPVSYLPYGMDATVSWGGPEFKFTNNRDLPIKIVTHCENRQLTVEIWGSDVDGSYVKMTSGSKTQSNGISATTYRCVYDKDGNLISRTLEANSFYYNHGSDTPTPTPTPKPTTKPEPQPTDTPTPTEPPAPTEEPAPAETDEAAVG